MKMAITQKRFQTLNYSSANWMNYITVVQTYAIIVNI